MLQVACVSALKQLSDMMDFERMQIQFSAASLRWPGTITAHSGHCRLAQVCGDCLPGPGIARAVQQIAAHQVWQFREVCFKIGTQNFSYGRIGNEMPLTKYNGYVDLH